ncbi:MAG: nitronate monooxygenase [Actinomycetota bacterium]
MTNQLRGSSPEYLCDILDIERPVLLAPMAAVAGGALAKAVTDSGGFGILGGGYGDPDWITREMIAVGDADVGIGLITWSMADGVLDAALAHEPAAMWMSFGDPSPHIPAIHASGAAVICQVSNVAEAIVAADAGADVIVAQGSEAGGHGRSGRSLFGLLPAISAAIPDVALVAAGGISDRRGYEAARALGASGVALGTAFYATEEASDVPEAKQRLVESNGDDTLRCIVYDLVRGPEWPAQYDGRCIRTEFTDEWVGREDELRTAVEPLVARYTEAVEQSDMTFRVVWAGEGLDAIDAVRPADDIVRRFPRIERIRT